MRFALITALRLCVAFAALVQLPLEAGTVGVSFFLEPEAMRDTAGVLAKSGCGKSATDALHRLVCRYYSEPFNFNLEKFPKPVKGFYSFASVKELLAALPHRLPETQHSFDFNCFDAVILLAGGRVRTEMRPDDLADPFWVSYTTTNGESSTLAATPSDAFSITLADWYREATDPYIPTALHDNRVCLTASFLRWHVLPLATTEDNLERQVLDVLRAGWCRQGVQFPRQFQVIMIHNVFFSSRTVCTCHAGLLFRRKSGYTYLEKAGGSGPFVRLDLSSRSDLLPWLATSVTNYTDPQLSHFATSNDESIEKLTSPK